MTQSHQGEGTSQKRSGGNTMGARLSNPTVEFSTASFLNNAPHFAITISQLDA
ncbi:hypothetical protein [Novipirellula galeiformis]|uniref:hypothetical protein n=1 Tax=Novipirellula galeiformis TaxID=2528004 RepID=UPI0018CDC80B|nr:hypothetical protein [Novipirellula galeiformis]